MVIFVYKLVLDVCTETYSQEYYNFHQYNMRSLHPLDNIKVPRMLLEHTNYGELRTSNNSIHLHPLIFKNSSLPIS